MVCKVFIMYMESRQLNQKLTVEDKKHLKNSAQENH